MNDKIKYNSIYKIISSSFIGADQFLCDIQEMIGVKSYGWRVFWSVMWKYLSPLTLIVRHTFELNWIDPGKFYNALCLQFVLIFNWIEYTPAHLDQYEYPFWANVVGWILALLPVFVIVTIAIQKLISVGKGNLLEVSFLHVKTSISLY